MPRSSEYPRELRERAVRMVAEVGPDYPSEHAATMAVTGMLGVGFLRGRTRPATPAIVTFIAEHKDRTDDGLRWGVESICAVLTQHGVRIAPSTYYDARGRTPSARQVSDGRWKPIILTVWQKQRRVLGARKLWLRLRRDGHDIVRCTIEPLMPELGIATADELSPASTPESAQNYSPCQRQSGTTGLSTHPENAPSPPTTIRN